MVLTFCAVQECVQWCEGGFYYQWEDENILSKLWLDVTWVIYGCVRIKNNCMKLMKSSQTIKWEGDFLKTVYWLGPSKDGLQW